MNAYQRRKHRRALPSFTGCGRQGYSGTTSYPDLMCTDGHMTDMDGDGYDPSVARLPCADCKPAERAEWDREQRELDGDETDMFPEGLWDTADGTLMFACRSCGQDTAWEGEAQDFDINHYANVCGGSPRCCP